MIDVDASVVDAVYRAVVDVAPGVNVTSEYQRVPPAFPCVSIMVIDNAVHMEAAALNRLENAADISYELQFYSNLRDGRKAQAMSLFTAADNAMLGMGYIRQSANVIPNADDDSIYRIVARYQKLETK